MKASVAALKSSGGVPTIKGRMERGVLLGVGDYKGSTLRVGTPIVFHSQHVNTRFKLGARVKSD